MVVVKHKDPKHRGGRFAGPSGTVYWVHTQTSELHATRGEHANPTAGCLPADAAEFAKFPGTFEIKAEKKAPPPPVASGDELSTGDDDDEIKAEKKAPLAPVETDTDADVVFPAPNATKATWAKWAEDHEVIVDKMEIEAHTKAELIEIIRERFAAKE